MAKTPPPTTEGTAGQSEVARVRCLLEYWRSHVDGVGDRQPRDAVAADPAIAGPAGRGRKGRIGKPRDAMRPHAPRDVEHPGQRCLLVGMGRRLGAARQQVPAGPLGGHEQGRLRVDPRGGAGDLDSATDLGRVGEVGHPVRAHAAGVGERRGELARRARSRTALRCGGGGATRAAQPGSSGAPPHADTSSDRPASTSVDRPPSSRRRPSRFDRIVIVLHGLRSSSTSCERGAKRRRKSASRRRRWTTLCSCMPSRIDPARSCSSSRTSPRSPP